MFDRDQFLSDLETFVGFKTVVCRNPSEFERANQWLRSFFDPAKTDLRTFDCHGLTSTLIKPAGSERPRILGDGHIEVVPGDDSLFTLRTSGDRVFGRGVADMKTQCLMMVYVFRRLIEEGDRRDFWLLFSEDEEVGSRYGVEVVSETLRREGLLPPVVFAPDGGPDFAYVEKEKGILSFAVEVPGRAAHASRPFLGDNAIDRACGLYRALAEEFPNPESEDDWRPSLSMTAIEAGEASNQIPESCRAGFDLRLTEAETVEEVQERLDRIVSAHGAEIDYDHADPATYYPRDAPVARAYLDLLRRITGREPEILHSAGASNGRIYVEKDPDIHVLMTSPTIGASHAENEHLDLDSLEPYYQLVYETTQLDWQ